MSVPLFPLGVTNTFVLMLTSFAPIFKAVYYSWPKIVMQSVL